MNHDHHHFPHRGRHGRGDRPGGGGGGHGPDFEAGRARHEHGGHDHRGHEHGRQEWGRHERGGFGERRRHGRRVLSSSELRLIVLKLVAEEPRHGYDVIRAVEDLTNGEYVPSAGVIYPALSVLQDMGLVSEAASEGTRRAFAVTEAGSAELADKAETVTALFDRLGGLAGKSDERDMAPIFRAMENLKVALRARAYRGDVTQAMVHDMAGIIDEAAQRVERLEGRPVVNGSAEEAE